MNRTPASSPLASLPIGTATFVLDDDLPLLDADDDFRAQFPPDSVSSAGLAGLLPSETVTRLRRELDAGAPTFGCRVSLSRGGRSVLFHLSVVRLPGTAPAGPAVCHLVLTGLSGLAETLRATDLEKKKYAIIADLTADVPFEYDFASDTMTYADKYRVLFGREAVIPRFRERLAEGESFGSISDRFRVQFAAMDVPPDNAPECYVRTADGAYRWFSLFCTRLDDENGTPVKAVGAIRDIDRQKREQLRLLDKSRTDAMTGLLNKGTTEEEIRDALCDVRPGALGALLMIDVDNFKQVNDTLGHMAGDAVIVELARRLMRTFRGEDVIGRVGGDEFHIFMRGARDTAAVYEKAREICSGIRRHFLRHDLDGTISISVGVACVEHPVPYGELFRQADVALYRAKANGKNRYEVFGRDPGGDGHRQDDAVSPLSSRVTRNGLLADIIDTLFSVRDMPGGIDKALDFLGNALHIDAILIYEKSLDLKSISVTHEWTAQAAWSVRDRCRDLPVNKFRLPRPARAGGIYYCSDLQTLPPEERAFDIDPAVTSLLQCDVMRDGVVVGVISFEERGHKRIWTQQEIDALILMSKLISGHVSQTRSADLLRQSSEATRVILNGLPGAYVYVISKTTHRLLYFNKRIAERFPHVRVGMTCHELFQHSDLPCEFCATRNLGDTGMATAMLRGSPFGDNARLSVSGILWENRESAYVALVSEHMPTAEERQREQSRQAYIQVLCDTCDYVLDIAADNGRYELLALNEGFQAPFPPAGDYTPIHNTFADEHIHADDRDAFRRVFSLPDMLKAFAGGVPAIEMEYRWADEAIHWKHRIALPHRSAEGGLRVLTYVRDITRQKKQELRSREEEADYLLALQSSYAEIFRIDLDTLRISPLYYNSAQVPIPIDAMDLSNFVLQRAENRVHPDSLGTVLAYYAPDRIRSSIGRGEITEAEYRKRPDENSPYRWIAATLRPVPGHPGTALLLLRDVSRAREDEANLYAALTNSYTEIYEMDLDEDKVRVISSHPDIDLGTLSLPYRQDTYFIGRTKVHPDDRAAFLAFYEPDTLRRALAERGQISLEYRVRASDGAWRTLDTRVLAVPGARNGKILVLCRDITEQKTLEEERNLQAQRFAIALRDTHTEIYEMDLDSNQSTLLVNNSTRLVPVGVGDMQFNQAIIDRVVHPDDRRHMTEAFTGRNLRQLFERGRAEVNAEFRRLAVDGGYRWVHGTAVPLKEEDGAARKAILLIKDIAERKREEQRRRLARQYDRALRNIYDELYELNITRDAYRIVYHTDDKYVTPPETGRVSDAVADVAEHMIHPDDKERFLAFFDLDTVRASLAAGREFLLGEFRKLWTDGAWHWAALTMFPLAPPDRENDHDEPDDEIYLVFIMDIDARKQMEEITRQNAVLESQRMADERYRIIVEQTNTLVFEWCKANDSRYISPGLMRRFAGTYDGRDILRVWQEDGVIHPEDLPRLDAFRQSAESTDRPETTIRFRTRAGEYIWCKMAIACLRDENGVPNRYIGTLNDVDDATRSIQALRYRAEYDTLTGVYNMQTFYARAAQLIRERPEREHSIIRMDIDRFKVINDLYGLEEGDRLLKTIAEALHELMHERGVCGRLSGDIFCVCADYTREETLGFINAMTERLATYPLASRVVPSFGICRLDSPDTPISVLCDWANLALKTVKGNVFVNHAFYDETLRNRILDEKSIESQMNAALEQGQFELYLQPKVYIPTSRIIGSEGLVRWAHPAAGIIPPDRFIPLFEKNGFVIRLDEYIWEQACITLRRWLDQGLTPSPVSVNVSRMHIHDTRLCEKLASLIARYRLPPHLLELELTESMFLGHSDMLLETVNTLQKQGFLLSLDDFGAGYSSLNMLKSLPIDIIKIDRGFLGEVATTPRSRTVVRHTIALARDLDMQIIAEGVETDEQAAFLLDAGCALAQGFHYSRPVPVAEFERLAFGHATPPFPVGPEIRRVLREQG